MDEETREGSEPVNASQVDKLDCEHVRYESRIVISAAHESLRPTYGPDEDRNSRASLRNERAASAASDLRAVDTGRVPVAIPPGVMSDLEAHLAAAARFRALRSLQG